MDHSKSILLVDDSAKDVELTLAALAENNLAAEVAVATDGVEALDYLYCRGKFVERTKGNPSVVLLDLKMPKVDGLQVLRVVKSDPMLKSLPVVVFTSSREESDLVSSYELGANAYVVKPIIFSAFYAAVQEVGAFWTVLNEPPIGNANKDSY